jgi:hypothetical protein
MEEKAAMGTQQQVGIEGMVFRKTNAHVGRKICATPSNSTMQHLAYGRMILDSSQHSVKFSTGEREIGLICLRGEGQASVDGMTIPLLQPGLGQGGTGLEAGQKK